MGTRFTDAAYSFWTLESILLAIATVEEIEPLGICAFPKQTAIRRKDAFR